jgi:hypothetical protein
MAYSDPRLAHFSLRGRGIDELRDLGAKYLGREDSELEQMTKTDLIGALSDAAADDKNLSRDLKKSSISMKPSFYLMRLSGEPKIALSSAKQRLNRYLQQHSRGLQDLQIQLTHEPQVDVVQVFLTWQSSYTYWAPTFAMAKVDQLEFGFAVLDYRVRKAILACHTIRERDEIAKLLAEGFALRFSSLVLTKPLLEQIGRFDSVKRALYVIGKTDALTPTNITYADEHLAAKGLARDEEENPRSQRQQSFYRIPITNPLLEEGVGATSDSGKLWIPKEIPFDSILVYCTALLARISGTLDKMMDNDEIEAVLATYKFDEMPELASADPLLFRESLARLLRILIVMLSGKEEERPYTIPFEIARHGAPRFFFYPRLRLVDPETGEAGVWTDTLYQSPQVEVLGEAGKPEVRSYPGKISIDTSDLLHPITKNQVVIENVLEALELFPNEQFLKIVRDVVRRVSTEIPKLKQVGNVAFRILGNVVFVDVKRAFGELTGQPTLISASDISELHAIISKHTVDAKKRPGIQARLVKLKEKCVHMSDQNCKSCVKDRDKLCLRSLVGRYLKRTEIMAHKGIELSDLSCCGTVGGREHRMWGFAKLPSGKNDKGLTLRNKPGAVLLAQIFGQIDKTTFKTALIISPSPVNQDFQERAEVLCSAFGKEICFLDADDLGRLLVDFEEQARFDNIDVEEIYKHSRTKKRARKAAVP